MQNKRSQFIPFIMAGHPTIDISIDAIIALSKAGADIIELGVPFSDPVADGPINQNAAEIALAQGTTLLTVFEIIRTVREKGIDTPIIIFSYYNPILALTHEKFIECAKSAGANGVLIVDLPPEEGKDFYTLLKNAKLEIVLLASPTTDPKRCALYQTLQPIFLYYISRLSVTGMQTDIAPDLEKEIAKLRILLPKTKIAVGFGISTTQQAQKISQFADYVIIGSLLVKTLAEEGLPAFSKLATELAQTMTVNN